MRRSGKTEKPRILLEMSVSRQEMLRVSTDKFNGKSYVDLRRFYYDVKAREYLPTRKGIKLPLVKAAKPLLRVFRKIYRERGRP